MISLPFVLVLPFRNTHCQLSELGLSCSAPLLSPFFLKHYKYCMWQTYDQHCNKIKSAFTIIRNKMRESIFSTLTQYKVWSHIYKIRDGNKMDINRKGRSHNILICRGYDSIHKKPYSLCQKTFRSGNYLQESIRIQNLHTKIRFLCTNNWERNHANNSIWSCLKRSIQPGQPMTVTAKTQDCSKGWEWVSLSALT